MPATKRTQFLMEPAEFRRLKGEARRRKTTLAELIRSAVRQVYFAESDAERTRRREAFDTILAIQLPFVIDWKEAKKEIESRFDDLAPE